MKIHMLSLLLWIAVAGMLVVRAEDTDSAPPAGKVGEEAKLLLRKVTLELVDTPLAEAVAFLNQFAGVEIQASQAAGGKAVSLKLENTTLAEAMRQIKDGAGAVHSVVDGKLLLALPEEWTSIDAGKTKFHASKTPAGTK